VIDAALLATALRIDADGVLRDGNVLGRLLETFVAAQIRPEVIVSESGARLHHLRTEGGRHEVDLIAELGGDRLIGIEVKANAAPGARDADHLAWLRDKLGDRFVAGVLLHTGPRVYALGEKLTAAPISVLWGTQ
jgi:predicted AAA+ superfamily ATPase